MRSGLNSVELGMERRVDAANRRAEMEKLGKELEPLVPIFLAHYGKDVFSKVERATTTEDQEGNDFFAELKNGKVVAIQWTFANDPQTQADKFNDILTKPVMSMRYNDKGEPKRVDQYIRLLMSGDDVMSWKDAKQHFDANQGPETYFPANEAIKKYEKIQGQIRPLVDHLAKIHPQYKKVIGTYQHYFNEAIPQPSAQKEKAAHANN